jgi:glutaminase
VKNQEFVSFFVIPAKAGIQGSVFVIPAKAGIHAYFPRIHRAAR